MDCGRAHNKKWEKASLKIMVAIEYNAIKALNSHHCEALLSYWNCTDWRCGCRGRKRC
jgi:hypothetical protein